MPSGDDDGGRQETYRPTTFVLTVGVESAAFADNPAPELQRILARVAEQLDGYPLQQEGVIRDVNGNTVGVWGFENPRVWRPALDGDE